MERILAVAGISFFAGAAIVGTLQLVARVAHAKGLNPPRWMTDIGTLSVSVRLRSGLIILVTSFFAEPFLSNWPFFKWLLGTTEAAQ
ncbi:hypothetical protein [Hyphococcus lacteus]|uniref:Uncharacterized protein n=1 Tax=Hyphococcus lacteus TaxID=3143536 RepID=A0ABV3Z2E5_9PROT